MKNKDNILISRTEVKKRFGLTDSIIETMEKAGTFPNAFVSGDDTKKKQHKRYLLSAVTAAIAKHGYSTSKRTITSNQAEKFAAFF